MVKIELQKMRFFAYHGLYEEEQKNGSWFEADVSFECEALKAIENDSIEGTVDYTLVYAAVKQEMEKPCKLIEHLAGNIVSSIQQKTEGLQCLRVTVYKLNAPVGGPLQHVSVTIEV